MFGVALEILERNLNRQKYANSLRNELQILLDEISLGHIGLY